MFRWVRVWGTMDIYTHGWQDAFNSQARGSFIAFRSSGLLVVVGVRGQHGSRASRRHSRRTMDVGLSHRLPTSKLRGGVMQRGAEHSAR